MQLIASSWVQQVSACSLLTAEQIKSLGRVLNITFAQWRRALKEKMVSWDPYPKLTLQRSGNPSLNCWQHWIFLEGRRK